MVAGTVPCDPAVAGAVRPLHAAGGAHRLPGELLERFTGAAHEALLRLLLFLTPLTVRPLIVVGEGR